MDNFWYLPFTLIISNNLYNSLVGTISTDAIYLSLSLDMEDIWDCYNFYVKNGMEVDE